MSIDYLNEAFRKLDLLEDLFDTSTDGIKNLDSFMDDSAVEDTVTVIDTEAETEDELSDSYVGKVIVNCNVCHSHIFRNKEDIVIDENGTVNAEDDCPYCGETEGFTVIGEIAPFETEDTASPEDSESSEIDTSVDTTEESETLEEGLGLGAGIALGGAALGAGMVGSALLDDVQDNDEDEVLSEDNTENKSLKMSRASRRIQEDFKEVSITTDDQHMEMTSDENGKVTVTTEPVEAEVATDETIVPVSDETEETILSNNDLDASVEDSDEAAESEEDEFDIEDFDEQGMDDLGESYLRKVYENVKSFKTTDVSSNNQTLIVEGVITFNSGAKKKTGFVFEAADANLKGQLRFNGTNKQLTESANAFTLVGKLDNKKLFVESLKYNYKVNDSSIRGVVRRK